ncbi:fibronectin type III domain-containing protein, partial [Mariniflexile sp. HMF6888]|uniref:fibronectin type III domain-containing protein n=1 Tax=Mariniflexile sp. HMF6888 TaxID=3373086 RepID=UPI0037ADB333
MKLILKLFLILFSITTFSQTNLLDASTWTVGSGSVNGFNKYGLDAVNTRETDVGPHGATEIIWKRASGIDSTSAGGWVTDNISIDHTKSYRFSVWIKKTNSNDGRTLFGFSAKDSVGNYTVAYQLNGYQTTNPYFWVGDIPSLNNWYLLVAYIHESSYTEITNLGGIYDLSTGNKALSMNDLKFDSTTTQIASRTFLYDEININDSQYFFDPRIYEINGQEPSIQELIDGPDTQAPTVPTLSSAVQTDTTVDLSWTAATDNIAVTGYKVYKDGVLETTLGNVLSYQVTGLTASTAYNFTVTALDAAGNESAVSNTVNVTTESTSVPATNLLDTSSWVEGTGPVSGFNISGASNENIRELGQNPYGAQGVLWKSQPADSTGGKRGWNTDYVNIDHTKTHRYTSWIKKTNSKDGTIYLMLSCKDDLGNHAALNLNGSVNGAPYPYSSDPQNLDQWYLLVGYIHHSGFTSTTSIGGVYDTNGEKVANMTDHKFSNTATQLKLENILWFSTNPNHALYTYAPTIYEVNGQEPTIQELIDGPDTQAPTAPTLSSTAQTDATVNLSWTA